MKTTKTFTPALALILLLSATLGCKMLNLGGSGRASSGNTNSEETSTPPIPAGYEKFFPATLGTLKRWRFGLPENGKKKHPDDPYDEMVGYWYGEGKTPPYSVEVDRFSSAARAQAQLKEDVKDAVPAADYEKRVRFPKCYPGDPERTNDNFDPPDELIRQIPLRNGGSAMVFREGLFWEDDCKSKVNNHGDEHVEWVDGVYLFRIDALPTLEPPVPNMSGKAEAFFNDYISAIGRQ
jgi:hypothetical protein